jgi:hypothetical protein
MAALKEVLLTPGNRPKIVEDCVRLIDSEVAGKGGLSGVAVKGAYAIVKKVKPGVIREAVDKLLDGFVDKLEGFYSSYVDGGGTDFERHLSGQTGAVANALLGVTDGKIARVDSRPIKKAYEKLRPKGEKHVQDAVPGVARVIAKYL